MVEPSTAQDNLVLYDNIDQCLTLQGVAAKDGRRVTAADLGIIENAAMVIDSVDERIVWVGESEKVPESYRDLMNSFSGEGEVWMPELIECHTHMVYGGRRHHDFAMRAAGKTYQEIARAGGGILTTLEHTRQADLEDLVDQGHADLERFHRYGVGIVEVKSGYGLSLESELKQLEVVELLCRQSSTWLVPTFLPAHATPPEFKGRTDEYVDVICREWIPEVAARKLARFFDVFVEEGYFSVAQARKLCEAASAHGFRLKLHVDQFTDLGGTPLAIELGAQSCDHLENVSAENIRRLGESRTVAVLCPGASLFTGTRFPPARALIDAGARVALSTDYNPGTCPSRNLPLMTTIGCSQMKMTVPEALAAVTYNAAAALGLEKETGSLEAGKQFRAFRVKAESYETLPYCFGEME